MHRDATSAHFQHSTAFLTLKQTCQISDKYDIKRSIVFLAHLSRQAHKVNLQYTHAPASIVVVVVVVNNNFKHLLFSNRLANQSQILCGASLGRGKESSYTWSRSHDQDGNQPIYGKPFKSRLLKNQKIYDFETWHVSSGSQVLQRFYN